MKHRHLTPSRYTRAVVDDVITRGGLADWHALMREASTDPDLLDRIGTICARYTHDIYEQRYWFWSHYVRAKKAAA